VALITLLGETLASNVKLVGQMEEVVGQEVGRGHALLRDREVVVVGEVNGGKVTGNVTVVRE